MAASKASQKQKRKKNAQVDQPRKAAKTTATTATRTPPDSDDNAAATLEPRSLQTVISEEELDITVETLNTLVKYPNLIKSKQCKDLRAAVYDFRQSCTTGVNSARTYAANCSPLFLPLPLPTSCSLLRPQAAVG
jgi:hypothetical protein